MLFIPQHVSNLRFVTCQKSMISEHLCWGYAQTEFGTQKAILLLRDKQIKEHIFVILSFI
jgi:hypothetical protein